MVMSDETKQRLIAATIAAIEENKGLRGVSLRGVAKAAGCSHVNVYHYADGLSGLLWLAYAEALRRFTQTALAELRTRDPGSDFGEATAAGIIRFARRHEGLYRLMWFEDLPSQPPESVWADITHASSTYREEVSRALDAAEPGPRDGAGRRLSPAEAADLFFAYLQGEISLLLNGRLGPDPDAAEREVLSRCKMFWTILAGARLP